MNTSFVRSTYKAINNSNSNCWGQEFEHLTGQPPEMQPNFGDALIILPLELPIEQHRMLRRFSGLRPTEPTIRTILSEVHAD